MSFFPKNNLIFLATAGSHAYGTNLPSSDMDVRGICVAPMISILSPFRVQDTYAGEELEGVVPSEVDAVVYEFRKFLFLLQNQNPNIVELAWVNDNFIRKFSPEYELIKRNRGKLLSRKVATTFIGYAQSQLGRMEGHNKWINNPQPVEPPRQKEFLRIVWNRTAAKRGAPPLTEYEAVALGDDLFGWVQVPDGRICDNLGVLKTKTLQEAGFPSVFDYFVKFNRQGYESARLIWKQYWTWKRERNKVRSELEEKHGYDTKHALHLIRLLRMGKEILEEGEVRVFRPDAKELLSIRAGEIPYEKLIEEAKELENSINSLVFKSSLPESIDPSFVDQLSLEVHESFARRFR